jgi:hypothetical protein
VISSRGWTPTRFNLLDNIHLADLTDRLILATLPVCIKPKALARNKKKREQ